MKKQNQNGSIHVILASVVVIVIFCVVGFLFWSNVLQPKTEEKSVAEKVESTPKASPTASPSTVAKPETVALSAWGVQFAMTDDLKKADVEVEKETSPTILADGSKSTLTYYYASTARQRAFGQLTEENASRLCDAGSGVSIDRTSSAARGDGDTSQQLTAKPIGGYYYTWSIPSAGGCDGPDTKLIVSALKSLEAI